jgi:CDP-diacylglycerol--serine O-phosphatidyltransferase
MSPNESGREGRENRPRRLSAVRFGLPAEEGGRSPGKLLLVPSFITVVGIFCGFLAIVSGVKGRFDYAAACIAIAFIVDGLDGRVARRLNATSAFGREFDSLSDVISFGVAPAMLVYSWAFAPFADDVGLLACFVYVACGAARLARFNIDTGTEPKKHFIGLPIPGAAAAIAALVHYDPTPVHNVAFTAVVFLYMFILAGLMVSTLEFISIKNVKLTRQNARLHFLALSVAVALMWYNSHFFLLIIGTGYALSGPVLWAFAKWGRRVWVNR